MGHHDTPVVGIGVLGGLDGLGESTDLVDLKEKGVARLELNGLLDAERVGDSQVITIVLLDKSIDKAKGSTYPTIWKSEVL